MTITNFKKISENAAAIEIKLHDNYIEEAILIRAVEDKFLDLFSKGEMNGTVHTCVGQEFSAVAIAGQLEVGDWVTSNHRCHGHFISKTKKWAGLVDELMGLSSGVSLGIGSSQHLYADGFISNGPQGALLPVAAGISFFMKQRKKGKIAVSYIGEGTLGEGVLYETFNLASLYQLPHLVVCENNLYSQSTFQVNGVSGSIPLRAEAFGIKTFNANTWEIDNLFKIAKEAIDYVRSGRPAFLVVGTYRLNAHSKGDDIRDKEEVQYFSERDPVNLLLRKKKWIEVQNRIKKLIDGHVNQSQKEILKSQDYCFDQLPRKVSSRLIDFENSKQRMVHALNEAYRINLVNGGMHIGEDIKDPYGGAFKVTKGLSSEFPDRVVSTPISEAGIVGMGIGTSLMGVESYVEIMFGDFITLTFDQIINNASKFHHMYAFNLSVPLRVRMPMGGKRGYGPTHSQSLEKFLVGIDNVAVIALTSLLDPRPIIEAMTQESCPILIVENKTDYGNYLWSDHSYFHLRKEAMPFGAVLLSPKDASPTLTIVSYGETARSIADNLKEIFIETDLIPELICITKLHPLDTNLIEKSVRATNKMLVVEAGSVDYGLGAEIISRIMEKEIPLSFCMRIGAEAVPIPSIGSLEIELISTVERILRLLNNRIGA